MAQNLRDHALRLLLASAEVRKHGYHLVTGHGPHILSLRNEYVLTNLLVVRNDKSKVFIFLVISDHGPVRVLQNAQDTSFGPS